MTMQKPIWWEGTSKTDLLKFPDDAIQDVGYQLHRLQEDNQPQDWKSLKGLGKGISGVYEVRIWKDDATFRVAYVTKFAGYVAVLHCWQKTTEATAQTDKKLIASRYRSAKEALK